MDENARVEDTSRESVVLYAKEAAELLRVSPWTVYELIKRKKLPAMKIGRSVRIPRKAVLEFIAGGGANVLSGKDA